MDQVLLTSRHFAVQSETSVPRTVYSRQPLQRRTPGFPSRDCRGNLCFFHQWVGHKCRHCVPPRGEMPNPGLSSIYDCWGTRGAAVRYFLSGLVCLACLHSTSIWMLHQLRWSSGNRSVSQESCPSVYSCWEHSFIPAHSCPHEPLFPVICACTEHLGL